MRKTTTSICLDPEVLQLCKVKGINISQTIEDLLRGFLEQKKERTEEDIKKDIDRLNIKHTTEIVILENELQNIQNKQARLEKQKKDSRMKELLRREGINV